MGVCMHFLTFFVIKMLRNEGMYIRLKPILHSPIATTAVDEVPLVRSRADTATIAAQRRATALRLALIVLEDEQIIGAELHRRAAQRDIRRGSAPTA